MLSGGYLFVPSFNTDNVLRYDESTGAFVNEFVPHKSGELTQPEGLIVGPDHNLYVSSGLYSGVPAVLRYNGTTGTFMDSFATGGPLNSPRALLFGPDGNLYVGDGLDSTSGWVDRFNGQTGVFMNQFVSPSSGGLINPIGMVFGPDGKDDGKLDLYVASARNSNVLRYDGSTGAFLGEFVPAGSGGLSHALGITIGPDGDLYVASGGYDHNGKITDHSAVLRFQGPSGPNPGGFIDAFVPHGSGGLLIPLGIVFGPDGNSDGHQDLYVNSQLFVGSFGGKNSSNTVLRYDGVTGAFIDTFVTTDSGGLRSPGIMAFTETDPTTLAFNGSSNLGAKAVWQNNSASISPAIAQNSMSGDKDKLLNRRSMAEAISFGPLIAEVASRPPTSSENSAKLPISPLDDGETSQTGVSTDWEASQVALGWLFDHVPQQNGNTVWDVFEGNEGHDCVVWSEGIGVIEKYYPAAAACPLPSEPAPAIPSPVNNNDASTSEETSSIT
jgi:hypothetical protein